MTPEEQKITDEFHKIFYPRHFSTTWMGHEIQKCPMDLLMYAEILYECKPDLVIECGSWKGGSALYLAHLMDNLQHGMILSIDVNRYVGFPIHPRIVWYTGSSVAEQTLLDVQNFAAGFRRVMVILDSDHTKDHVLAELESYSPLVTQGQYLIVEDTNIHGHPVRDDLGPGPFEAIQEWFPKNDEQFMQDSACERFLLTQNPGGYLRRMR